MSPIEVSHLLGSDPEDLHGAVIIGPAGVAAIVIRTLAEHGFEITGSDH